MNKPTGGHTAVVIRKASVADAEDMSAIVHHYSTGFLADPKGDDAKVFLASTSPDRFVAHILSANRKFFVAAASEAFIGFISLRDDSHINQFFVLEDYHQKGIGSQLWNRVRAEAAPALRHHKFTVKSSLYAVPVYERFGFTRTADRTEERGLIYVPMELTVDGPSAE